MSSPNINVSNSNSSLDLDIDLRRPACCRNWCSSSNCCCSSPCRTPCRKCELERTSRSSRFRLLLAFIIGICEGMGFPCYVIYWIYTNYEWRNLPTTIYIGFLLTSAGFELTVLIGFAYLCCYYKTSNNAYKMCSYCNMLKFIFIIAGSIKTIISIQTEEFAIDKQDNMEQNIIAKNLRQYYSVNEEIPQWIHDIQSTKKCCGIFGPSDWKKFIYPLDKSAIEDVPESCCKKAAVGCNQILIKIDLFNQTGTELNDWIYTKGCRQELIDQHNLALNYITYCLVVCVLCCVVLGILYWIDCINGPEKAEDNDDDDDSDVDESPPNSEAHELSNPTSKPKLQTEDQVPEEDNNNDLIINQSTNKFKQRMLASCDRNPEMYDTTSLDYLEIQQQRRSRKNETPRGILKKTSFYSNDSIQAPSSLLSPIQDISATDSFNCCEEEELPNDDDYEDNLLSNEISKLPTRKLR